ncbi:RDD family protein [Streptomyces sp. NBC_00568]|uniref:RDD family protein n=1 Tax=Streptomyces sp. NBC_00568 TaxID=2975779 RepID=UPI002254B088|nr:RDD family protein [Streptomyces sp. NBC_00568]MCX4990621.1 RDD family protein [Streptomyces sp. NBC_00568]
MSAPTPAPGDDKPREGYYPDPSIPGYVRYWNGAAWVPGTSRPAPSGGEALAPPAGVRSAHVPAPAPSPEFSSALGHGGTPTAEETGPHFFDEDPQPRRATPAEAQHGSRPEPATAWGADRSQQSGFGGDQDRRVSWGAPQGSDPRVARATQPADAVSRPDGAAARTDGTATIPPADSGGPRPPVSGGPVVFRRPTGPVPPTGPEGAADAGGTEGTSGTGDAGSGGADGLSGAGTGVAAGAGQPGAGHSTATPGAQNPVPSGGAPDFGALSPRTEQQSGARGGGTGPAAAPPGAPAPSGPSAASGPSVASAASAGGGFGAGQAAQASAAQAPSGPGAAAAQAPAAQAAAAQAAPAPAVPQQSGGSTPMASGVGGGQPSWAQQVHRLAGDPAEEGQRVTPWKPPVDDVFQAAARRHSAARPAGLGRRLAARLVDTVVLAGVTAVAAVPLGTRAVDHVNEKIDAAELSGEKVTVWLLDGTTATCFGIILAVLLLFGVLYDVLPTAKWGRTLGKKLCGVEVRDIEGHEPPAFGRALGRWLVYSVPGLLLVGVVGVLWCLFDRPWRQCWHDKAAHTFVAASER